MDVVEPRPPLRITLVGMDEDELTRSLANVNGVHIQRSPPGDRGEFIVGHIESGAESARDASVYWMFSMAGTVDARVLRTLLGGAHGDRGVWAAYGEVALVAVGVRTHTLAFAGAREVRETARLEWMRGRWWEPPLHAVNWYDLRARPAPGELDAPLTRASPHTAAAYGDIVRLRELIGDGGDDARTVMLKPDASGVYGWRTPLHVAACNGRVEAVEVLAGAFDGTLVRVRDDHGRTPLHAIAIALRGEFVRAATAERIMRVLLDHHCDACMRDVENVAMLDILESIPPERSGEAVRRMIAVIAPLTAAADSATAARHAENAARHRDAPSGARHAGRRSAAAAAGGTP